VVKHAPPASPVKEGEWVFVPGSYTFTGATNLFGGAGATMVVPHSRVIPVDQGLGANAILLALAATVYHAVSIGGKRDPIIAPDLIVGHGVMGRLLARLVVAAGLPAPTVWETNPVRQLGGEGYKVIHPDEDTRKDYQAIYDVSGDGKLLNSLISRLAHGGEVVLAGFYTQDLSFAYPPAFMREAQIRVATEWKKPDLLAVNELIHNGRLSLDGLLTHTQTPDKALDAYEVAFGDPHCLKMVMDWRN
jgi:3-hydroxyethyl bacteriochlorophyllide a dehydrogenase